MTQRFSRIKRIIRVKNLIQMRKEISKEDTLLLCPQTEFFLYPALEITSDYIDEKTLISKYKSLERYEKKGCVIDIYI